MVLTVSVLKKKVGDRSLKKIEPLYGYLRDVGFVARFFTKPSVFSEIVLYQELLCEVTLQESTSNHDDRNRNEKQKKYMRNGLNKQNKKLHTVSHCSSEYLQTFHS